MKTAVRKGRLSSALCDGATNEGQPPFPEKRGLRINTNVLINH